MRSLMQWGLLFNMVLLLWGCGQTGTLYLPTAKPAMTTNSHGG